MNPWSQFDGAGLDWLGAGLTTTFMVCFVGWAIWAYAPSRRAQHEASSRIPFEGGER